MKQILWRNWEFLSFLIALALFGLGIGASAQVTSATILGVVKDSSEAVLPGVTVTVKDTGTGMSRSVVTDDGGRYRVSDLLIGNYEVQATLSGFKEYVQSGINLTVGQTATINIAMQVGAVTEQVTVNAEAPLVETSSAQVAGLVSSNQVHELPLNGRSFDQLAVMQAGVQAFNNSGKAASTGFSTRISVSGARIDSNNLIMDGIEINDWQRSGGGSAAGLYLGVDAVQEFQVLTHNYSAEFGRNAGGIFNVVTRAGSNVLHGSAYEFLRNDNLDARNFFDLEKSTLARNQFGAYVGGPIIRDKAFFAANYEGFRERRGSPMTAFVLSQSARSAAVAAVAPYVQPSVMPLPNAGLLPDGITGRYVYQFKNPTDENYGMGRVDYALTEKDSIFVRYTRDMSTASVPDSQGASPFFWAALDFRSQNGVVAYTRILSPTLVNNLRLGVKRSLPAALPGTDPSFPQNLSFIPGQPFGRLQFATTTASSATAISNIGQVALAPGAWFQTGYQINDHLVYTRGSHTFKLGAEYELLRDYVVQSSGQGGPRGGTYQFTSPQTFLAGTPSMFQVPLPSQDLLRDVVQNMAAFYAIDDIRVTPRLTLNLGLREEFMTAPYDRRPGHTAAVVNPLKDSDTTLTPTYFPLPLDNFAPRVGFAWDVFGDGKTSLRSGFGMYHNLLTGRDFGIVVQLAPQYRGIVTVQPPVRTPVFPNEFAIQQGLGFPVATSKPSGRTEPYYGINTPTALQYNVEIQRQLSSSAMVRVSYIGSRSYHLISGDWVNTRVPTILANGQVSYAANAPLQNPNLFSLEAHGTEAQAWYNSFQADFRLRPTHGLELQANYVWSRNIDNGSTNAGAADAAGAANDFQNPMNHNADIGLSALDARHRFSVNYLYEIPAAPFQGMARHVVNGWSLGGIVTLMTGNPFTGLAGFCRSNVAPNCNSDRPNLAPGASNNPVSGTTAGCTGVSAGQKLGTPNLYYDPCAFQLQPSGFFGNLGRNTLIGPGLVSVDFSVYKRFNIGETKKLQFRAEAFNLLNHANFGLPGNAIFTSNGAYVGSAGVITTTVTKGREIQFGLRFSF